MGYKLTGIYIGADKVRPTDKPRQPTANTLIYYTFNDQNLNDTSGNNNNGTWHNGTGGFTANTGGYCANLGSSHAIQLPIIIGSTDFTINEWIKYNSFTKEFQGIFGCAQWSSGALHANMKNTKMIELAFASGQNISYQTSMVTDTWYNLCITKSGTTFSIYINGSLGNSGTGGTISSSYTQYLGTTYSNNRYLDGYLDSIIIENTAWTAQDISDYYDQTKANYGIS